MAARSCSPGLEPRSRPWRVVRHLPGGTAVRGVNRVYLIVYPLAFLGMPDWPAAIMLQVMLSQFVLKVSWEVLLTPVTYAVVGWLKRKEGVDVYDIGTDFTPFTTKV